MTLAARKVSYRAVMAGAGLHLELENATKISVSLHLWLLSKAA